PLPLIAWVSDDSCLKYQGSAFRRQLHAETGLTHLTLVSDIIRTGCCEARAYTPFFAALRTSQWRGPINLAYSWCAITLILLNILSIRFSSVRRLRLVARDLLKWCRRVGVAKV
ncbi:MAG: hypothetical protein WCP86_12260, partial [bacterium]